jgi:hypothetical protein
MSQPKEIKYKMTFTPVVFNFKTKKVDFGEEMTTEIMANEPMLDFILILLLYPFFSKRLLM